MPSCVWVLITIKSSCCGVSTWSSSEGGCRVTRWSGGVTALQGCVCSLLQRKSHWRGTSKASVEKRVVESTDEGGWCCVWMCQGGIVASWGWCVVQLVPCRCIQALSHEAPVLVSIGKPFHSSCPVSSLNQVLKFTFRFQEYHSWKTQSRCNLDYCRLACWLLMLFGFLFFVLFMYLCFCDDMLHLLLSNVCFNFFFFFFFFCFFCSAAWAQMLSEKHPLETFQCV